MRTEGLARALVITLAAVSMALLPANASAQSEGEPVVAAVPREDNVDLANGQAAIDITIAGVENLAAFQFVLRYDSNIFDFTSVEEGPFLSSTGRAVVCNDPQHDTGSARYECITLGATPAGATGDGTIATVYLRPKLAADTTISLGRVQLLRVTEQATGIPARTEGAEISIRGEGESGGFNWLIWGPVIAAGMLLGCGALVLLARRFRISPPTRVY